MKAKSVLTLLCSIIILNKAWPQQAPPLMGWASWNHFHMDISETIIKGQADAMVSSGLAALGYKYINIDDGFFNNRYSNGTLRIDSVKFPSGMKSLTDYIHSKGLKAGFYSEAGSNTCGSMYDKHKGGVGVGLYNHEQEDINLFFKVWGFDFLKVDYCGAQDQRLDEETRYKDIRKAIDNTGIKGINFNVCRWQFPGTWVTSIADSWRISVDIRPTWDRVCQIIDKNAYLAAYASPGHYNDMDMLEVGRGLKPEEDKTHFSMWCMLGSPLVLGNDLRNIPPETKEIITNTELIAINQDITGDVQARIVSDNGKGLQVWSKAIHGKQSSERAVVLLNRTDKPTSMSITWEALNLAGPANVRDLWSHKDMGTMDSMYTATVPAHGVVVIKVTGKQAFLQEDFEAEYAWINNYNLTRFSNIIPGQGTMVTDASCSGRAKAVWLGNSPDNYIEFRNVYAKKAGEYNFTLYYISSHERNATILVNGVKTELVNLNSHDWKTISSITVPVKLREGANTIRILNEKGWLPDMDKIHINLNSIN